MPFTVLAVVADGDSVRRRLLHQGGLTVRTVTDANRERGNVNLEDKATTCVSDSQSDLKYLCEITRANTVGTMTTTGETCPRLPITLLLNM